MSQKSFLDNKKSRKNLPYVGKGGVNQQMENSISLVVFIFESFPYELDTLGTRFWQITGFDHGYDTLHFASQV